MTRLLSRVGRGQNTGIDRVELGYLRELLIRNLELFGLARLASGQVLFDRCGLSELLSKIEGNSPWSPNDMLATISRRLPIARRRVEATARSLAVAHFWRGSRYRALKDVLPEGVLYLNVGHSNLDARLLAAIAAVPKATIVCLIHDAIPLNHPQTQRPQAVRSFREKIAAAAAHANGVIASSAASADEISPLLPGVPVIVSPLGLDRSHPEPAALAGIDLPNDPFFVCLGTLEPRKNHALLLRLWSDWGPDAPGLCIVGQAGWASDGTVTEIERLSRRYGTVRHLANLSDAGVAALLERSAGLLFPSRAEGFGLPPLEALALGVPSIVSPLPVYQETLGELAVYADPDDTYQWKQQIEALIENWRRGNNNRQEAKRHDFPTWSEHLNQVLSAYG